MWNKKHQNKKYRRVSLQAGMSYVELIVVLSIFAMMSSVTLYSYGSFQGKVDVKNLANDIALKVVEAQKASLGGKLPPATQLNQTSSTWKPSYGVYIDRVLDDKSFMYFTDVNQLGDFSDTSCLGNGECLQKINITKGNTISRLDVFYSGDVNPDPDPLDDLSLTFKRPDSNAIIKSRTSFTASLAYVQITVLSPKGQSAKIKIYPSGRVQIN